MEYLLRIDGYVIRVAYIICATLIIWRMRDKSIIKGNIVLSVLFYIAGLSEIIFCDIAFPKVLIWLYAFSISVNFILSCELSRPRRIRSGDNYIIQNPKDSLVKNVK